MGIEVVTDVLIQGSDVMIYPVPDRGVDSAVNNGHSLFNQSLILWLSAPCRKNNAAVMVGEVKKIRIDHRFILIGFGDSTFQVIRNT